MNHADRAVCWARNRRVLALAVAAGSALGLTAVSESSSLVRTETLTTSDARDGGPIGQPGRVLELRVGIIDTARDRGLLHPGRAFVPGRRHVVQLDGPLTPARQAALAALGVELGQYLPQFAYIVDLSGVEPAALAGVGFVSWVGVFEDAWKLDPQINNRVYSTAARRDLAGAGMAELTVLAFDGADPAPIVAEITRLGGKIRGINPSGHATAIDATMRAADAPALAALPEVQFVEDGPEVVQRNDSNRWIVQSNVSGQTPIWNKGIHGEGQMGGLIDGTPRESHCMFDDSVAVGPTHRKIVAIRGASSFDSHGTHTAGTMAGDNAPLGVYTTNDGLAFAAKISATELGIISSAGSSLSTNFLAAHNDGARVHSNSWGDDGTRNYTNWCRQIDLFTHANEDSLVAFAVSNGSIATTPENSMNVLGVGASQDAPNQGSHCTAGTGPTLDGRRKPEVYAPGCNTQSANSSTTCGVVGFTGTSMACPAVSGAGLLVRQYFTEGWYPSGTKNASDALTPSGALIKAVLVNTSVDMTGITGYPSNLEGWGRVLLDESLYFAGDAAKLFVRDVRNAQGLATGDQVEFVVLVNSSAVPLEITLASTHPAAAVNASNPVINNIDLEVIDPIGATYRGNVFTSGQSSTGGTADAKNNVERVVRNSPAVGAWTIRVKGTAVNSAGVKQGFALVAAGDVAEPSCPADFNGDGFVNGDDFDGYVAAFEAGDAAADFNADGFISGDDFDAYVQAFSTGC